MNDSLYKECGHILDSEELEERKIDLLEEYVRGRVPAEDVEGTVLQILWQWRSNDSEPAVRPSYSRQSRNRDKKYYADAAQSEHFVSTALEKRMTPFDMLRTVIGHEKSDAQIKQVLAQCEFDLAEALNTLMQNTHQVQTEHKEREVKKKTVCRHFMNGACMRSDCWFSHDIDRTVCKYWLAGNCLAGENCVFSHDPTGVMSQLTLTPKQDTNQQRKLPPREDDESFPTLGSPPPSNGTLKFTSLPSLSSKWSYTPQKTTLAQVVKSAKPQPSAPKSKSLPSASRGRPAIQPPTSIPYLSTVGSTNNAAYLSHRADAISQGAMRNKFLSLAAEAWRRGDAAGAKKLSLRANECEVVMRSEHKKAADAIFGERNPAGRHNGEEFLDLHALHPDEAISFLETRLLEMEKGEKPLYAIVGSGHHSSQGIDRLGRAVKSWLDDWGYRWREFKLDASGEFGGVIGIDPSSYKYDPH